MNFHQPGREIPSPANLIGSSLSIRHDVAAFVIVNVGHDDLIAQRNASRTTHRFHFVSLLPGFSNQYTAPSPFRVNAADAIPAATYGVCETMLGNHWGLDEDVLESL